MSGTSLSFSAFEVPIMAFDFALKRPHVFMISASFFWPSLSIPLGVFAFLKSSLVTRFTLMSVHCAERITAINASNGVFQFRVGFGFG